MTVRHWKGGVVPTASDAILSVWPKFADSLGVIVPADSVAAARALLTLAETDGHPPSAANPLYLDINGVIYRATGAKGDGGAWVLTAIGGHTETFMAQVTQSQTYPVQPGGRWDVATVDVGTKPYDRFLEATFTCFGQVTQGVIDLHLTAGSVNNLSRFPGTDNGDTVSVSVALRVPAGTNPAVRGGVTGSALEGESRLYVTPATGYSALYAKCFPVDMG